MLPTICTKGVPDFRRPIFIVRVTGESMWPELVPGKRYWASGWRWPRVGDIAVCVSPEVSTEPMVKKVRHVHEDGYALESVVSWGSYVRVPAHAVRGKIIGRRKC